MSIDRVFMNLGIALEQAFSEIKNFVVSRPSEVVYLLLQNFLDPPNCFDCDYGKLLVVNQSDSRFI